MFAGRKKECTVWQWFTYDDIQAKSTCLALTTDGKDCGRKLAAKTTGCRLLHLRQRVVHSRSCRSISLRSVIARRLSLMHCRFWRQRRARVPVTFVFSWRPGDCACKPGICWANFLRLRFVHGWTPQQDGEIARNESVFETQFSHNRVTLQWLSFLAGLNF